MWFVALTTFYPLSKISRCKESKSLLPLATRKLIERVDGKAHRFSLCVLPSTCSTYIRRAKDRRGFDSFQRENLLSWQKVIYAQQVAPCLAKQPCARQVIRNYCSFYLFLSLCKKGNFGKFHLKNFAGKVVLKFQLKIFKGMSCIFLSRKYCQGKRCANLLRFSRQKTQYIFDESNNK